LHLQPDFRYSIVSFVKLIWIQSYKGAGGRKVSGGERKKTRPKNSAIKPPSTLSVSCMKTRGRRGHGPLAPLCRRPWNIYLVS